MILRSILRSFVLPIVLFAVCSYAPAQGIPCRYEVAHIIQAPPCGDTAQPTFGLAISPNGRWVVGYHCACICISDRAFVFDTTTGVFTTLPLPAGMSTSFAYDVNDAGQIAGHMGGTPGDFGFVYHIASGEYTLLPPAVAQDGTCRATGINSDGLVCGTRTIGGPPGYPTSAFIWSAKDGFTDLGVMNGPSSGATDIADNGIVVGWTGAGFIANAANAFVRSTGALMILPFVPGGFSSAAVAVSKSGAVAVYGRMDFFPGTPHGFVHRDGDYVDIGVPPGFDMTLVADIGANDAVVGTLRRLSPSLDQAFVWHDGLMQDDLGDLIPAQMNLTLDSANAIAPSGLIVAGAENDEGDVVAVVLTPEFVIGDVYPDCLVNIDDLLTVIRWWGPGDSPGDANGDGTVNLMDLLIIIEHWST